jgi:ATP-dependent RNA helicase DDX31/DBP7
VDAEDNLGVVDEDAARRMKMKMMAVMNTSSEFNLG